MPLPAHTCLAAIDAGHTACIHTIMSAMGEDDKRETRWLLHAHHAVDRDSVDALQALHMYDVGTNDETMAYTMNYAVQINRVNMVRFMLDSGMTVNEGLFWTAAWHGALACLQLFRTRGLLCVEVMPDFVDDADLFMELVRVASRNGDIATLQWVHTQHNSGALTAEQLATVVHNRSSGYHNPRYVTPPDWDAVIAFYAEHGIVEQPAATN